MKNNAIPKQNAKNLNRRLTARHILFIGLGSAIGTGLFYGSADAIQLAGPSVIFAYMIAGGVAFMIMRALGEMAIQNPIPGSFASYASMYVSPLAGFIAGWSYVVQIILVCLADITAFATYMGFWYPHVAPWLWALSITLIISAFNLFTVKIYGELEFWFSIIKVIAIISMIIGGFAIIFFGLGTPTHKPISFNNLWSHGGWFVHGWQGFLACFGLVLFAFGGIEVIGLTAAEAENPDKTIRKAINAIPIRIILFYVLTITVLITIHPWNEIGIANSPFVTMFEGFGIHSAANILNIVVITAAISAINSDFYGTSRMLHGLAQEGNAPKHFSKISKNGVPIAAVGLMFLLLIGGVILNLFYHKKLFFIVAIFATFSQLIVWIMIMLTHFIMRLKMRDSEKKSLRFPIPFWPIGPLLTLGFLIVIPFFFGTTTNTQSLIIIGISWLIGLICVFYLLRIFTTKKKMHQ